MLSRKLPATVTKHPPMETAPDAEAEMSLITFDSKGDIVLEQKRLLVTLASPVFEAMFKPTPKGVQGLRCSRFLPVPSSLLLA